MSIRIEGLDRIESRLDEVGDISRFTQAMKKACLVVEAAARKNAPKDTGALRRSIESKTEVYGNEVKGIVFTNLEYAPYVEFGYGIEAEKDGRKDVPWRYQDDDGNWHTTSGHKPQPFMRPAMNENRQKVKNILKEAMVE